MVNIIFTLLLAASSAFFLASNSSSDNGSFFTDEAAFSSLISGFKSAVSLGVVGGFFSLFCFSFSSLRSSFFSLSFLLYLPLSYLSCFDSLSLERDLCLLFDLSLLLERDRRRLSLSFSDLSLLRDLLFFSPTILNYSHFSVCNRYLI